MASTEEFSLALYRFEPEYSTSEESLVFINEDESESIDEECIVCFGEVGVV